MIKVCVSKASVNPEVFLAKTHSNVDKTAFYVPKTLKIF
jgi:hypothetical protein